MIKTVLFDMDGVLFDTERLAIRCWDTIGQELGLGKVGYMVYKTLGRTTEESVKIFQKEFGERFHNDLFQQHYKAYLDRYYEQNPVPVKEGVYPLLSYLKERGYATAVASSSSRDSVLHHLEKSDTLRYFDAVISGDMAAQSKPEPDIYIAAAKALGKAPQECYAIEDSKSGLWSAHRAGCKVVMVPDIWIADEETEKIIDIKLHSLSEFQRYLEQSEV